MVDADPRPLTRDELAKFLPDQRSIRAFEKLFDLVPTDIAVVKSIAEEALALANIARSENIVLQQEIQLLKMQLDAARRINYGQLLNRIEILEVFQA